MKWKRAGPRRGAQRLPANCENSLELLRVKIQAETGGRGPLRGKRI